MAILWLIAVLLAIYGIYLLVRGQLIVGLLVVLVAAIIGPGVGVFG